MADKFYEDPDTLHEIAEKVKKGLDIARSLNDGEFNDTIDNLQKAFDQLGNNFLVVAIELYSFAFLNEELLENKLRYYKNITKPENGLSFVEPKGMVC